MAQRPLLIEMAPAPELADAASSALWAGPEAAEAVAAAAALPPLPGVQLDTSYPPTQLPGRQAAERSDDPTDTALEMFALTLEPEQSTYLVRAFVEEDEAEATAERLREREDVVGVYADPEVKPTIVCPGSAAVGTDADVERLLCTAALHAAGADGTGVLVAIVDTGLNVAYLNSRGKTPAFDSTRSWSVAAGTVPGAVPVNHGTMCAYDVCIAAPKCTLIDVALLRPFTATPSGFAAFLSDAVRAYRHLVEIMLEEKRPGGFRSLVVNNSWGMFDPAWDFPPGDAGNYSDNPNHPFNLIVGDLARAGADILFAAGNCGPDCPDGRCGGHTSNAIYGANGHGSVLCVAGVDVTKTRVGYSTVGPGRLTHNKPDISSYTHFRGSGVYPADGGTSAATPVAAGVVAAVRSRLPYDPATPSTHPAAIRTLLTTTAEDLGSAGYDFRHGFGVIDGCALERRLRPTITRPPISICDRYPWLCRPIPIDLCRRYPWLCRPFPVPPRVPVPPFPPGPLPPPVPPVPPGPQPPFSGLEQGPAFAGGEQGLGGEAQALAELQSDPVALSYALGYYDGQQSAEPRAEGQGRPEGCGCGD